jgi:hypothetical protein
MSDGDTNDEADFGRYLPVVVERPAPRPSLVRTSTEASFLSQLIAARDRAAPQRDKRRAPTGHAVDAYSASATSTVRRMPKGYNRTVVA